MYVCMYVCPFLKNIYLPAITQTVFIIKIIIIIIIITFNYYALTFWSRSQITWRDFFPFSISLIGRAFFQLLHRTLSKLDMWLRPHGPQAKLNF